MSLVSGGVTSVKQNRPAYTKLPRLNAIDGLIVLLVSGTIFVGYLRFSEPYRIARPGSEAVPESLRIELCMPSGFEWLVNESIEGYEERNPRTGLVDVRLLHAYRDSDSLTRVKVDLVVRREADGTLYFRDRPLVLGMRLRFNTSKMVVEGSLCQVESDDETR